MPGQRGKNSIPYVILGSEHAQNLRFYESYDEAFLYNKVATFLYVLDEGEPAIQQIEARLIAAGGAKLSQRYLESIRAEILFTTLHQCETFFALLIALFQPLPHWVFLTTYKTEEIKQAIEQIVAGKIGDLTSGSIMNMRDFVKVSVYCEVTTADQELASRWDENIDNAAWLIERIGAFFLKYDRAYNSYKHGLRVMNGPYLLAIAPQNLDGTLRGPMHIFQEARDALTYLEKEPVREVDGEKEIPLSEVTKAFNPFEASFYMAKMSQMLETIKATRLAALKGSEVGPTINTFFGLDRDQVLQLAVHEEWKRGPMRADEARGYEQFIAQMRANAEKSMQPSGATDVDSRSSTNAE